VALLIFGPVFCLCQICATFIQNTWLRELLSILRPTNLSFAEWPSMFGDAKMPRPCLIAWPITATPSRPVTSLTGSKTVRPRPERRWEL